MENQEVGVKTYRDYLEEQLGNFRSKVIGFSLDLKRHLEIREQNPDYQKQTQNGQFESIDVLVERYESGLNNALSYVRHIEDLLRSEEGGTLEDDIQKIGSVLSPYNPEEEGEEADDGEDEGEEEEGVTEDSQ